MLDDDHVAIFLDERWRVGLELRDELRREATARQRNVGVFERVCHAADAIMMLDQHVFLRHLLAGRIFRWSNLVFDDFEHVGV